MNPNTSRNDSFQMNPNMPFMPPSGQSPRCNSPSIRTSIYPKLNHNSCIVFPGQQRMDMQKENFIPSSTSPSRYSGCSPIQSTVVSRSPTHYGPLQNTPIPMAPLQGRDMDLLQNRLQVAELKVNELNMVKKTLEMEKKQILQAFQLLNNDKMRMDQGGQRPNSPWGDNAKFEELNRLHKMEKKSLQDEIWRLQRQLDQCTGEGELGNNSFISRFQKTGNYNGPQTVPIEQERNLLIIWKSNVETCHAKQILELEKNHQRQMTQLLSKISMANINDKSNLYQSVPIEQERNLLITWKANIEACYIKQLQQQEKNYQRQMSQLLSKISMANINDRSSASQTVPVDQQRNLLITWKSNIESCYIKQLQEQEKNHQKQVTQLLSKISVTNSNGYQTVPVQEERNLLITWKANIEACHAKQLQEQEKYYQRQMSQILSKMEPGSYNNRSNNCQTVPIEEERNLLIVWKSNIEACHTKQLQEQERYYQKQMTQILSKMESGGSYNLSTGYQNQNQNSPRSRSQSGNYNDNRSSGYQTVPLEQQRNLLILWKSNIEASYIRQLREMENYYQRQLGQSSSRVQNYGYNERSSGCPRSNSPRSQSGFAYQSQNSPRSKSQSNYNDHSSGYQTVPLQEERNLLITWKSNIETCLNKHIREQEMFHQKEMNQLQSNLNVELSQLQSELMYLQNDLKEMQSNKRCYNCDALKQTVLSLNEELTNVRYGTR